MKKLLALLLVFVLVFSVVACGPKTEETTKDDTENKDSTEEPKEEKAQKAKLNLVGGENIPSLVTWLSTDAVSFEILGNINGGLMNLDTKRTAVPDLAESYEVSEDGLTYTFKLRDNKWTTVDGEVYAPVTAQDFVYAWKKLADPKEASAYAFMIKTAAIKNGKEAIDLSELIVAYDKADKNLKSMKVGDFQDIEAKTPEAQLEEAKAELEKQLGEAADEEAKKEIQKKIDALKVEDYEAIEAKSAQEQFDEAKAAAEEEFAAQKEAIESEYGSIDEANKKVSELIDSLAVEAVDDKTLKVTLSNPVPYFLDLMTFPSFFPANQKFVEEKGDAYGTKVDAFLYDGPYIFKEWKLSERHYLVKNPNYWDAANVAVDEIDVRVIEKINNDTAVQMYLDKEIDRVVLSGTNVDKYGNRPDALSIGESVMFYLHVNQGKGAATANTKLLQNAKARKALNMGINKKFITDKVFNNGSVPADYFLPKDFVANADGKEFREVAGEKFNGKDGYNKYNVEEAKKLWKEAKEETGMNEVELELMIYQGESASKVGAAIKDDLEKNLEGLKINIQALPFSEKIKRAQAGDYELDWAGWGPDYPDAMTFTDLWVTGGGHNTIGYENEAYDKLIEAAKNGELTAPSKINERFEALVETEKMLLEDDQAIIPLYQRGIIVLNAPKVKNWVHQVFGPDVQYKYITIEE